MWEVRAIRWRRRRRRRRRRRNERRDDPEIDLYRVAGIPIPTWSIRLAALSNGLEKFFVKTREHPGNRLLSCEKNRDRERGREREKLRAGHRKRISRRAASEVLSRNFLDEKLDASKVWYYRAEDCTWLLCNFNPLPLLSRCERANGLSRM